jgi:cytochrome c peroxidase
MNIRQALLLAVPACLAISACGGDSKSTPAQTPAAQTPAAQTPAAQAPAAAAPTNPAPAAKPNVSPAPAGNEVAGQDPKPAPKKPTPPVRLDMVLVKTFFGSEPMVPAVDNPSTPEKVALGKALYHEQHLSKNGNLSCASCHNLSTYGVDNKPTSPGSDGKNGDRNTPTTYNAFRNYAQFWDARATTVEEQSIMPVLNPVEHGIADEAQLVAKIKEKAELVDGFKKAFPGAADPVTADNFKLAIGAFERTLVTKSKFDKFVEGDQKALTNEEKLGLKTFMDTGCTQCHMTRLLGGNMIQKLGVYKPYATEDTGRMKVTGSDADKFMFKVPSLLNIAKTAPYYHDGKIATLEEAVHNMAEIQLGKTLTKEQTDAIVAFLNALTGELPAEFAQAK